MFSKMVILIPVYNPRERIINYVKKLKEKNYDVIVINDGSDENYHAVFERMVYDCKIINYPHFKGKGYALKKGYQYVKEHLKDKKGILILENEYDLKLVDQMSQSINEDASKFYFVHHQGKKILSQLFSLIYNQKFINVDSELFGFSISYLDEMLEVDENCYEVQALIDQVQNQHDIEEIKVKKLSQEAFHPKNKTSQIIYVIFLHLIRFVSSSIISSIIDVLLAWILLDVLKIWMTSDFWRIALASLIARVISTIVNYEVNKKYVFKGKTNNRQTAIRFLILTVIITILSTLFVYVASIFNIMSEKLPGNGIECVIVPRKTDGEKAISASTVRQAIKDNDMNTLKKLVPESTLRYFESEEAKDVIARIRNEENVIHY